MSASKHQHFIPKSYLKNFALIDGDKAFVEAKQRKDDVVKPNLLSIRDICVDKNLYTLPYGDVGKKYALETFYANEVDAVFPEVYGWLTDPNLKTITLVQRAKIVMTCMSLYFRTPKFLNQNTKLSNRILEHATKYHQDTNGHVLFKFRNYEFDFDIKDLESVKNQMKLKRKFEFLQSHLKEWHQFIQFKIHAGIGVVKVTDEAKLITSDNPVIIHNGHNALNLFDLNNIIQLPIDPNHYLIIYPNSEETMLDTVYRSNHDKWWALTTNLQVEQNCEDWILGLPGSVSAHLEDQQKYGKWNDENIQNVVNLEHRATKMKTLTELMSIHGLYSEVVAEEVRSQKQDPLINTDGHLLEIINLLKANGYDV